MKTLTKLEALWAEVHKRASEIDNIRKQIADEEEEITQDGIKKMANRVIKITQTRDSDERVYVEFYKFGEYDTTNKHVPYEQITCTHGTCNNFKAFEESDSFTLGFNEGKLVWAFEATSTEILEDISAERFNEMKEVIQRYREACFFTK